LNNFTLDFLASMLSRGKGLTKLNWLKGPLMSSYGSENDEKVVILLFLSQFFKALVEWLRFSPSIQLVPGSSPLDVYQECKTFRRVHYSHFKFQNFHKYNEFSVGIFESFFEVS
jgi:hypothetical protein